MNSQLTMHQLNGGRRGKGRTAGRVPRLPSLALILLPGLLSAQTLLVPATGSPQQPHFNPAFMARNRVAEVKGQLHVKRENEPMKPRNEHYLYRFDSNGQVTYSNNSFGMPGSGRDTASVRYDYNGQGHLLKRSRLDLSGHYSEEIELDSAGRPLRETHVRIENLGTDRYNLVPGTRTEVSDERFRHERMNDTTIRTITLNSLGLPYKERVHTSDRNGYLLTVQDRYIVTGRMGRTAFTYNEKGLLASRIEQSDLSVPRTVRYTYTYDQAGNLQGMDTWHNDALVTKEEYVYTEGSLHLKAKLTKDMATGIVKVVRYEVLLR